MTSLVSVFIPAYNAAPFLARAIESVFAQTYQDFDLWVIDDASTDHTPEVITPYLSHDRLTYVRNRRNLGMSANWNKGIELAQGKYIAKLDADDFYHPGFLKEIVSVLEANPSVGLAFCGVNWHVNSREEAFLPYTTSWVAEGDLFLENNLRQFVTHSATVCVRAECYQRLGGFVEQMRMHSDWEMWTRIAAYYKVAYVNQILATMVRHSDNCTTQSRFDTRSPDDLSLWLRLLDEGTLTYQLTESQRFTLEAAMVKMTRSLLKQATSQGVQETARACADFLLKRRAVPPYEKVRYRFLLALINQQPDKAILALRSVRWTEKLWNLERFLAIQLPAQDPSCALLDKAQPAFPR